MKTLSCERFYFLCLKTLSLVVLATSLIWTAQAATVNSLILSGLPEQGSIFYGKTKPGSTVVVGIDDVPVADDGRFVFGVSRDNTGTLDVVSTDTDGMILRRTLLISPVKWEKQTENNVPDNYAASPTSDDMYGIVKDSDAIKVARSVMTTKYFPECFIMPVENAKIVADFGVDRVVNGVLKQYHGGIDIKADEGTYVMNTADGVVTHINTNSYYNGKMIIINHGYGISSTYSHLSKIYVDIGQEVFSGDIIGEVGNTGRSLYPHLHFGLHYKLMPISPLKAVLITKKNCNK